MKKIVLALLCIAVILLALWFGWKYFHAESKNELTLYGNVDIRQVDLAFRVGGRIASVLVEEGVKVKQGQELAILDRDLLTIAQDEAKAALEAQAANLELLRKGYREEEIAQAKAQESSAAAANVNADANYQRVLALSRKNAVSQRELDNALANRREASAALRKAKENLDMLSSGYRQEEIKQQEARLLQARAALERAQVQLGDAVLYAPEEGIILSRAREAGAIVGEGQTVYTLTLTNPVWLRVYVNEPELGLIKPGMSVKIAVDAAPGKFFEGHIGFISPSAEFTPKTVETKDVRSSLVYRVRVIAEDPENLMRQGMPVTVICSNL